MGRFWGLQGCAPCARTLRCLVPCGTSQDRVRVIHLGLTALPLSTGGTSTAGRFALGNPALWGLHSQQYTYHRSVALNRLPCLSVASNVFVCAFGILRGSTSKGLL